MSWASGSTAPGQPAHPAMADATAAHRGEERVVAVTVWPADQLTPSTVALTAAEARTLLGKLDAAIREVSA